MYTNLWIEATIHILSKGLKGTWKYELLKSWHNTESIDKFTSINRHTFDKVIPMLLRAKLLNTYKGFNNRTIYTTTEKGKIFLDILNTMV